MKSYLLLDAEGRCYASGMPGALGGNRQTKIFGKLDCRSANRALVNGSYQANRVFFEHEDIAKAAGFRPCATCMPLEYRAWRRARSGALRAAPNSIAGTPHAAALLGRDNSYLSGVRNTPAMGTLDPKPRSFSKALGAGVEDYVRAGVSPATREAYRADLSHFEAWGGVIPATEAQVASYLAAHASVLAPSTLSRRLAAISVAHGARGYPTPTASPLVRATLRGIRREHGAAQMQAKPLLREDLFAVLAAMSNSLNDVRDRALLLIGFAGGFRRSELIGLDLEDIQHAPQGLIVTLRRSKTDQEGRGRKLGIPFGRAKWCPVAALRDWVVGADIERGPIFRPISRHGQVSPSRLSGEAVCAVLRKRLEQAGYDPVGYSGHSLRAGLATSAAQFGVASWKIRAQTGHASDAMLSRYVRDGELFVGNAAGAIL